jgi:outer membrane protein assembly factor BamD (BamD/ComL family)
LQHHQSVIANYQFTRFEDKYAFAFSVRRLYCSHCLYTTPDSKGILSEQGYYDAAQKSLSYGNFETATKHLEALESHYPVGAYTEQAN